MFPNQPGQQGLQHLRDQQERMRQQDLRRRQMGWQMEQDRGLAPPPLPPAYQPGAISRFFRWITRLLLWFAGVGALVFAGLAGLDEAWGTAAAGLAGAVVLFALRRPFRWR